MENKKFILSGSVITSAILALTNANVDANSLSNYSSLGSGAEVRTGLLGNPSDAINAYELTCAAKDAKSKDATCGEHKKDGKAKDAKCGEGKCGEHKKDGKAKDAKCGEHKTEGKAKDAKCGEKKPK